MKHVLRYDTMPIVAQRDENGFLVAPAAYTRTGVFYYINDDGSVRAELRMAEEVFKDETLNSLRMLPVTDDHPPEMLNPNNAKKYSVGFSSENVIRKGDLATGHIKITDGKAIALIESKEKDEMSCGYTADLEFSEGVYEGVRYDAIQRNIRYNHIAIVQKGRAGSQCRIKTDSADVRFKVSKPTNFGGNEMLKKIRVDGIEIEVSETAAQVIAKETARRDMDEKKMMDEIAGMKKDLAEMKKKMEQMSGKKDAAEADLEKVKSELEQVKKDASDFDKIQKLVNERTSLINTCKPLITKECNFDSMSDIEIKKAVVAEAYPEIKLDEASDDRVEGLFEGAKLAAHKTVNRQRKIDSGMSNPSGSDDDDKLISEHRDAQANKWKKTLESK